MSPCLLCVLPPPAHALFYHVERATVGVFLTAGFCFYDELEYMHLNAGGERWGNGPRGSGLEIRDQLSAIRYRLVTRCY
jgi:hypothetical protein